MPHSGQQQRPSPAESALPAREHFADDHFLLRAGGAHPLLDLFPSSSDSVPRIPPGQPPALPQSFRQPSQLRGSSPDNLQTRGPIDVERSVERLSWVGAEATFRSAGSIFLQVLRTRLEPDEYKKRSSCRPSSWRFPKNHPGYMRTLLSALSHRQPVTPACAFQTIESRDLDHIAADCGSFYLVCYPSEQPRRRNETRASLLFGRRFSLDGRNARQCQGEQASDPKRLPQGLVRGAPQLVGYSAVLQHGYPSRASRASLRLRKSKRLAESKRMGRTAVTQKQRGTYLWTCLRKT